LYGGDGNNDDGISNTKRKAISICGIIGADQNVNVEEVQHHFFDLLLATGFLGCSVEVAAGRWAEAVDDDVDDDCFIMMRSNAACHLAGLKVLVSGSPRIDDDSQCWIV